MGLVSDDAHEGNYEDRGHMLDGWKCSCGWKSQTYFDGAEYARTEWKKHIEKVFECKPTP
jgi:hypothetical protein